MQVMIIWQENSMVHHSIAFTVVPAQAGSQVCPMAACLNIHPRDPFFIFSYKYLMLWRT
jgi:hypothetical protein